MNKNTNKLIILTLAILFLPMSAMATYSNDFSCNCMNGFTLVNSWSAVSGFAQTTASGSHTTVINTATYLAPLPTNNYWSIVMYGAWTEEGAGGVTDTMQEFRYEGNATSFKSIRISYPSTSVDGVLTIEGEGAYTPVAVTGNVPIYINVTNTGSNIVVGVYTLSTMALINQQTISLTPYITTDRLVLYAKETTTFFGTSTLVAKFDNIYVSGVPPTMGSSIQWEFSAYTVGESPSFSWAITDSDWNSHPLQLYVARLYKSGILQDWGTFNYICLCSTQLALAQSGSYSVSADVPGTYLVTLELLTPFIGNSPVDDSTTSVHAQSSSYFTIPATANQNTNVSSVYHLGTGGMNGVLQTFWIDGDGIEQFEKSFYTTGLDGTQNISFNRVGRYNVKLYNYNDGTLLQTKSINIVFVPNIPTGNFATSSINTTSTTYNRYDILSGNYRIDAANFTIGTPYISIYNYDIGAETARFYNQNGQSGMISGVYLGTIDYGVFDYYIVNSASGTPVVWLAGNNSVRLMMQNSTSSALTVLAYSNFTLSELDSTGYGLAVQPTTVNINENVRITTTCPADCIVSVSRPNGGSSAYNMSSGTRTMFQAYPTSGKWGIALMDSGGHVHMTVIVTVTTGVSPGVTPPSGGVTINTAVSLLNVFGVIAFWGFVIWLGIVGSVIVTMSHSTSGINGTAIIAVAWFAAIFIAIIGLFDPFKIYIIVISTIIAAVYFKFGRTTTMED